MTATTQSYQRHFKALVQRKKHLPLSVAVSEAVRRIQFQQELHDDISNMGAPSECHGLVSQGYRAELDHIASKHGFVCYTLLKAVVAERVKLTHKVWQLLHP